MEGGTESGYRSIVKRKRKRLPVPAGAGPSSADGACRRRRTHTGKRRGDAARPLSFPVEGLLEYPPVPFRGAVRVKVELAAYPPRWRYERKRYPAARPAHTVLARPEPGCDRAPASRDQAESIGPDSSLLPR